MKQGLLAATILAVLITFAHAQTTPTVVPHMINYQGKLTGATTIPVLEDTCDLTFRIWSDPDDVSSAPTNLLWVERYTSVPVMGGYFNVILGTGEALAGFENRRDLMSAFGSPQRSTSVTASVQHNRVSTNRSGVIAL